MSKANNNQKTGILLESGINEVEFLIVSLGEQKYGINVSKVCQILVFDPKQISEIPNQVDEILGVITFREQVISIIDLSMNLKRRNDVKLNQRLLIITEFNQRRTGFIVDGVERIERVNWSDFEPITGTTCNGLTTSVVGTIRRSEGLVIILDLESILASLDPSMSIDFHSDEINKARIARDTVRVLHCEDSIVIQKLVLKVLSNAGFTRIEQVANGAQALELLNKNGKGSFDIVLSDIEMPSIDGLTMCRTLREDPRFTGLPVVFFSSMINEQMAAKCRSVGGNAAYSKPQINMIVSAIEDIINKERSVEAQKLER
jgi:two-component system, chemotaxis family, chemotaxis protein CheV